MTGFNDADIELAHYSGAIIPLVLETIRNSQGVALPRSMRSALSAAQADSPLPEWFEPYVQETWYGGAGGGGSKYGYTQAPGLVTNIGDSRQGFAFPGPAENIASVPDAGFQTATGIHTIEEFLGNLYFVQGGTATANTPRVMVAVAGGATLADSLGGVSGQNVAANNALTGATVFRDRSTGTRKLWVSGVDANGARLHSTSDGAVWTSTASNLFTAAFGSAIRFDWLQKVFWRTANGDQAWRLVAGDMTKNKISYTRPNADPMLAASWVLGAIDVDTTGTIRRPPSIRRHLYSPATDNVFDIDELGDTPGLVSDMDHHRHPLNGWASIYGGDDYLYLTLGHGGVGRVYVGEQGLIQPTIGQCGPGAYTAAQHEYGGFATCFGLDQGDLLAANFNPNNGYAGIWRGRDRRHYPEVETNNPMLWWGPSIHSTAGYFVTAMRTFTNLTASTIHLWVAFAKFSASAAITGFVNANPKVSYFTLPVAGQPLSDFLTGGSNLFAVGINPSGDWQPSCRLVSMPTTGGDKAATKFLDDATVGSENLDVTGNGTNIELFTRADPATGSTSFPAGVQIGTSPTQTVTPGTTTYGNKIQYMISILSPHGADALPTRSVGVLDSVRFLWFRRAPVVRVLDVTVQYGHGIRSLGGGVDDSKSVDAIRELLQDLTEGDRTTMRIRPDRRYTILARQVMDEQDDFIDGQERSTVRMQLGILAHLSG